MAEAEAKEIHEVEAAEVLDEATPAKAGRKQGRVGKKLTRIEGAASPRKKRLGLQRMAMTLIRQIAEGKTTARSQKTAQEIIAKLDSVNAEVKEARQLKKRANAEAGDETVAES